MGGQGETRETRAAHPRSRPEAPAPTAQGVLPSPAAGVQAARACRPPPGAERSGVSRGRVPGLALFAEGSPASAVYREKTRPLRPGEPGRATHTLLEKSLWAQEGQPASRPWPDKPGAPRPRPPHPPSSAGQVPPAPPCPPPRGCARVQGRPREFLFSSGVPL